MSKPRFAKTGFRAALIAAALMSSTTFASAEETIKVGILHSLSGTMAISETTLACPVDSTSNSPLPVRWQCGPSC